MSFESRFADADDDAADVPELWAYAADPTIANARALLAALGIASPRAASRAAEQRPAELRAAAPGLAPDRLAAAIAVHARVGALCAAHGPGYRISPPIVARVFAGDDVAAAFARFPGLRETLSALARQRHGPEAFARRAVAALNAAFGLAFREDGLGARGSDRRLRDLLARWRAAPVTEIVLDGFACSPDDPAIANMPDAERTSRIARSQALCAFVMLLLADDDDPALADGAPPSCLEFLAGPFQTMYAPGWRAYMRRWTAEIRDAAPRRWARISFREIAPPIATASGAEVRAAIARLPNGRAVPLRARERVPDQDELVFDDRIGLAALEPTFGVSANRTWFRDLFEEYARVGAAERAAMDPLVDDAIAVNALRDAIKADLAIARGAAYVTYDRLAMMYHELRRLAAGAPAAKASALWLYARGVGDAKLGAYE